MLVLRESTNYGGHSAIVAVEPDILNAGNALHYTTNLAAKNSKNLPGFTLDGLGH